MGLDTNEKILADNNDVFADIMNVLLYDGRRVISEDALENAKDRSRYKADGKIHEQERDVSKFYKGKEFRIAFLGIEHQSRAEPLMPLRVISYDGSVYRAQLNERSLKKPYPVITVVLYFGTTHWPYGKSLHDILEIPEELKPFVSDYQINVVEVAFLTPEQIEKFQSDFRIVADYFAQKRLTGAYIPSRTRMNHTDEILKIFETLTGDNRFEECANNLKEKGEITMCEVVDGFINKGIEQGVQMERVKTEEQRARADALQVEVDQLKEQLAKLQEKAVLQA